MTKPPGIKVLLIGGTSHVGKTTLARQLAGKLGWSHLSTDQLARHPGRPWSTDQTPVPDDVIAHYSGLGTAELVTALEQHYQDNVWPIVEALVRSHVNNPYEPHLVFEGSAILPRLAVAAGFDHASCIWLTSTSELIIRRILDTSNFDERTQAEKQLINAFLHRTLAFNETVMESARQLGQQTLDASAPEALDTLADHTRLQ